MKNGQPPTTSPWRAISQATLRAVPLEVHPWLHLDTSMTKQLQRHFAHDGQAVTVRALRNGPGALYQDEQYLFPRSRRPRVHVREVLLHANQRQLIVARTVFISRSLHAKGEVAQLGSRPLGELLFAKGKAIWLAREFAHLEPGAQIFSLFRKTVGCSLRSCWARRTLFLLESQPLLVTEMFLPTVFEATAERRAPAAPVAHAFESAWTVPEPEARDMRDARISRPLYALR